MCNGYHVLLAERVCVQVCMNRAIDDTRTAADCEDVQDVSAALYDQDSLRL